MKYFIVTGFFIILLVLGVRHWDFYHDWKGIFTVILSTISLLYNSYWLENQMKGGIIKNAKTN